MNQIIWILIILVLSSFINSYSNILEKVRKDLVEKALFSLPSRIRVDILKMYISMKEAKEEFSLSDEESAFLVYKWITLNIKYDCSNNKIGMYETPVRVYYLGIGNSRSISELFTIMCSYMGVKSNYILGYIKTSDDELVTIVEHNWNYIEINNKYYLIDVSLAMGVCGINGFSYTYSELYFDQNPEIFIRSHFPLDNKWQLLNNTITKEQFTSLAFTSQWYYLFGFNSIYPDSNIIKGL
jgi:transglutaminase/protease-like cytokinesis protein 3